ncbi:Hypothetical protein FKW44_015313 [Caligus rogercresseyi]|uniref:Uncharacterized protein n=1 Tax=Caligus rogercresseyi TaxID=217165 RepID=A0A7T8K0C1_CALRO|nr:Hypothetical protein FKW44_015313 [Caligus rogercresseyi]
MAGPLEMKGLGLHGSKHEQNTKTEEPILHHAAREREEINKKTHFLPQRVRRDD